MTPPAVGTVIVADVQEAGRGQHGNTWASPRGGLYASIVLQSDQLLSPRIGVAVARALRGAGVAAQLKWPNDVLVHDKKIAGILIEVVKEVAIVGIGVNIDRAPLPEATCITSETEQSITRDDLLHAILQEIEETYSEDVIEAYRRVCSTIGRAVQVDIRGKSVMGIATEIDRNGHLLVSDGESEHLIVGGRCQHLDRRI